MGDAEPAHSIERARSLVSVSDGRTRNQLTSDEDDPHQQRGDDPAVRHLEDVVGHPDHPHAEHPGEHEGGQAEAQVPLGDLGAGTGADIDG